MNAGSQALTTTPVTVFDSKTQDSTKIPGTDLPCGALKVKNAAASSGNVLVNVSGLHEATEFDVLEPGDTGVYRFGFNGITKVICKSDSTATALVSVMSRGQAVASH